jgi:ABC-type hemin transport system substrate-binding protein
VHLLPTTLPAVAQIIIENNPCLVIGHERANKPNVISQVKDKPIYFKILAS